VISPRTGETVTLEQLASDDPAAALDQALQLSDAIQRRHAAERIAAIWVADDPLSAIAAAEQLPGRLRTAVKAAIDTEWARLDATGYLAHIEANPEYLEKLTGHGHYEPELILERSGGIRILLASDPLSVVNLADNLSSRLGTTLKTLAFNAYAERDPFAAIALAERIPRGQKRDEALAGVGTGYALADPEGALAWAQSLSSPPPILLANVFDEIARYDIRRAIELALQVQVSSAVVGNVPQFPPIDSVILNAGEDSAQALIAANSLLVTDSPRRDALLDMLLGNWVNHDPESVLGWIGANSAGVNTDVVSNAAYSLASKDPALAASYTDRVPVALRSSWIDRVAQGYAMVDAPGALDWISRYQGQEGYDVGLRRVIVYYAGEDPRAAARVLESASPEIQLGAVGIVADRWARQDGAAAADWARGLSDASTRTAALTEAVGAWMSQSSQLAENWSLALPAGADRDRALYVLIRGRTYSGAPYETFSTNPTESLISQISDAGMRREVEAWFKE
jgi:hypothetical protein